MGSRRYRWIATLLSALLLGACGELTPPQERSGSYAPRSANSYTVRPGDTLYSIAWDAGLDHREVAVWNNIPPPYTIYPGQRIVLVAPTTRRTPIASSKPAPRVSPPATTRKSTKKSVPKAASTRGSLVKPRRPSTTKPVQQSEKVPTASLQQVEKVDQKTNSKVSGWRWPTRGKVVNRFDLSSGKKGIDISGRSGQEIFTAAAGDVVYSGNGLLGYGNLVIIKHDDTYLSAYGHNSQLLVKEGDKVTTGQKIAEMGVSSKDGAILHFEIRKEGKPVDPLVYLPK